MKLKVRKRVGSPNYFRIESDERWVVSSPNGYCIGAKHITEEQAADISIAELSYIRECLGTDFAIEIIL